MSGLLEIFTLGGLTIKLDSVSFTGFSSRKAEALLIFLACTGRTHARERLADLLWDERSQAQALSNLRPVLSYLRRDFAAYLNITRQTVGMNPAGSCWLDVARLEADLAVARDHWTADGDLSPTAAADLARALDWYQGDFLEGFYVHDSLGFDEWLLVERERLRRQVIEALHYLVASQLNAGAFSAGLVQATRLLKLDPLREEAHQQLMMLLARTGQRSAALAQYDVCSKLLDEELGVKPMEETAALYRAIRAGELDGPVASRHSSDSALPPLSVSAERLTKHDAVPMADRQSESLASASEPLTDREHEILVCLAEGLSNHEIANRLYLSRKTIRWYNSQIYSKLGVHNREAALTAAKELGLFQVRPDETGAVTVNNNLPVQTTAFVGRRSELTDITALLGQSDIRLITILAPGGMGKTRLALAVAEQVLSRFPDGVFFVPLAPLRSPDDMITAIAESVGFRFYGSEPPRQQLLAYLRDKSALLLLDNLEHLLDGVALIADLLQAGPHLKLLTTSRETLSVSGETIFRLSGLRLSDGETPAEALETDAAKLFMQSARRVRPEFVLQAEDIGYLAQICRITAGMPLALVLAARWIDVLTPQQIADEIQQGLDILESDLRDMPERHRSIRACFNHSWTRLSDTERRGFMKLSVFRGGFTAEAALFVAGANIRHLRQLVNRALVQTLRPGRYDIHELLRQFGEAMLTDSGEADAVRQAHSAYHLAFLAGREADIKGRRQQAALEDIRADFENIRQAWLWAADHRQYEAINRALNCLTIAYEMNSHLLEAQYVLRHTKAALRPAVGQTPHPVWDAVSVRLERFNFLLTQVPDGQLLLEILDRTSARDDILETAWCHWGLADYRISGHDRAGQAAHFEQFHRLCRQHGEDFYIGFGVTALSYGYAAQNQADLVLACLRESVEIRRGIGDWNDLVFSLQQLATKLIDYGFVDEGEHYLDEALVVMTRAGIAPMYASCRALKGELAIWRGKFDVARDEIEAAMEVARKQNYLGSLDVTQAASSYLLSLSGQYQQARLLSEQSRSHPLIPLAARHTELAIALACCGLGDDAACRQALRNVLQISVDFTKSRSDEQLCLPIASILAVRNGSAERAVELLGLAFAAPEHLTGWMKQWSLLNQLRDDLLAQLGPEAFAAAWQQGPSLDLETVVQQLLAEYAS